MNKIDGGKPARVRASGYLCTVNKHTDEDVELLRGYGTRQSDSQAQENVVLLSTLCGALGTLEDNLDLFRSTFIHIKISYKL